MRFFSWLRHLTGDFKHPRSGRTRHYTTRSKPAAVRVHLEALEDRCCPSASYTVTDLGTLGGAASQANAINSMGQVAGSAQVASGSYHPFLYTGGVMTDLGVASGFTDGSARAVNAAGQVAVSEGVAGNSNGDAFLWQSGSGLTDLGNIGSSPTTPLGINNATSGHPVQVVGTGTPTGGGGHAWLWQNGVMTDLNTLLPANSGWVLTEADGINDNQQIVGQGIINGQYHAYLWQPGTGAPKDLGTLPGTSNSGAKAINKMGQVAGWSNTPPPDQDDAVLWTSGQINDLGPLPKDYWSQAAALNSTNSVQVVGTSVGNLYPLGHAVLWQSGKAIDLTSQLPKNSGWLVQQAYGINDAGWIIGEGQNGSRSHAVLLTPSSGGKTTFRAARRHQAPPALPQAPVVPRRGAAPSGPERQSDLLASRPASLADPARTDSGRPGSADRIGLLWPVYSRGTRPRRIVAHGFEIPGIAAN
jgi:probable HAF family extracellular repeat protein